VQEVLYQFPKAVVSWTSSEIAEGKPFTLDIFGSKGTLTLTRGGFQVSPEMKAPAGSKEKRPLMEPLATKGGDLSASLHPAHARNFLDCVKSRQKPNADVEEGHRTAVMCHLGNISMRLGRSIRWDAVSEQAIGDPEANHMLSRPYRAPWKLG
jgi:myo-inositol 2-dehydrogenase / D-chiro-inositol 1-dehydrogenase